MNSRVASNRWKQLNNFQRRGGAYALAPIARQAFLAVPVRNFEWLWNQRRYQGAIEIEVQSATGWRLTMEFQADSTEQINVRPKRESEPELVRQADLGATYVPPMTGLSIEEPVYQRPKLDQLLGLSKPGEIIRNLLLEARHDQLIAVTQNDILRRTGRRMQRAGQVDYQSAHGLRSSQASSRAPLAPT